MESSIFNELNALKNIVYEQNIIIQKLQ